MRRPISTAVIEQQAALEYAGPRADRVEIAEQFASDPIGIVEIDLRSPVLEDSPNDDSDDN